MALTRPEYRCNVRNLRQVRLEEARLSANVFYGANGSGKTSVLEAIHLLGMARSFRGNSVKSLITHERGALHCARCSAGPAQAGSGLAALGVRRARAGRPGRSA